MVMDYFDKLPDEQREQALERAMAIGVMAMRDDRIAAFLSSTENSLALHLASLKQLFETQTLALKSAPVKGAAGELALAQALTTFTETRRLPDSIQLIGNVAGALPRNKTGDILCLIGAENEDGTTPKIVIECKLDKSIRLGDPAVDGLTQGKSDTAWSQLMEARTNRGTDMAIMVFASDSTDRTIGAFTDSIRSIPGVGYIVVIDIARGDFRPLAIAYELAREQVLSRHRQSIDAEQLDILMRKFFADVNQTLQIKSFIDTAKTNLEKATSQIDSALANAEATRSAISQYLRVGRLDNGELLKLLVPHKAP